VKSKKNRLAGQQASKQTDWQVKRLRDH